jgi:phage tail sheath gpL-like
MPIGFSEIPSGQLYPFISAEFNSAQAQQGLSLQSYRGLLVGQKLSAGTGTADTIRQVFSADEVLTLAGRGSQLHRQAVAWFSANRTTEVFVGILADNPAAVKATGTVLVAGPSTAAGIISLYIGGQLVQVAVASGMVANDVAAAINAAINAATNLPVVSAVLTATCTLEARNGGVVGNEIDVRVNYQRGEATPAGLTLTIGAMASGAGNPSLTALIAAMGDTWFNLVAHPYTDATSLSAIEVEMASRSAAPRQIDGVAITATNATVANAVILANTRNSPSSCVLGVVGCPTWSVEAAASLAGVVASYGALDPARPFWTLPIPGVLAPAMGDRITNSTAQALLTAGISTITAQLDGSVAIQNLVTTYKTNAAGSPDTAYKMVNTRLTLMYARYSFRVLMASKYPRHKLASDGTLFGAGQPIITPKIGRAEAVSWFRDMMDLGLFEGLAQFKRDLVVERNALDPNRLDFLLPPDLINQLMGVAASLQFRL